MNVIFVRVFNARNIYFRPLKKDIKRHIFWSETHSTTKLGINYLIAALTFFIFNEMDSLIKAAENFEQTSVEESFDEKTFVEFMKKVPIWEYFAITKQAYLTMSEQEKRDKISKYYSDMKSRQSTGEFCFIFISFENVPP